MYDMFDGTQGWGREKRAAIATDVPANTPSGLYARMATGVVRQAVLDMRAYLDARNPSTAAAVNAIDAAAWVENGTAAKLLESLNSKRSTDRLIALGRLAQAVLSKHHALRRRVRKNPLQVAA